MNLQPAIDLIEHFEGCVLHAYQDIVGVWTIGFGTTVGVHPGMVITQAGALELLLKDIDALMLEIKEVVNVQIDNNELCALLSFTYNLGFGAFHGSTLLKELNAGSPRLEVANQFLQWVHAGGQVVSGLVRRRKAERELFLAAAITEAPLV